jgi:hypothetical protein
MRSGRQAGIQRRLIDPAHGKPVRETRRCYRQRILEHIIEAHNICPNLLRNALEGGAARKAASQIVRLRLPDKRNKGVLETPASFLISMLVCLLANAG